MAKVVEEKFIESLDVIADRLKMPNSVAGATLLAMGTSAPELSTALIVLFRENSNPGIGVGTIVGSAIFQILVVIGFSAIVKTSYLNWKPVIRDGLFYAFSILLLIYVVGDGIITVLDSTILVCSYFIYLIILIVWTKTVDESGEPDPIEIIEEELEKHKDSNLQKNFKKFTRPIDFLIEKIPNAEHKPKYTLHIFILCLGIIAFLCYFLVLSAEATATILGVPPTIIALTILAGGSSVPELISSAIVSKEGRGDMAISNAVGSNIFDILLSLGLPLLIFTSLKGDITDFGGSNITSSIFLLFATLLAVLILLASQKFKAGRKFGYLLIFSYICFVFSAYLGYI